MASDKDQAWQDQKPPADTKPPPIGSPLFSSLGQTQGGIFSSGFPQGGTSSGTQPSSASSTSPGTGVPGGLIANANFGGAAFYVPPNVNGPKVRNFQLGAFSNAVTPKYREQLTGDSLFKFHRQATIALTTPFTLKWASMNTETELDFFENNNALMNQIHLVRSTLESFGMDSVFSIFDLNRHTGLPDITLPPIALL